MTSKQLEDIKRLSEEFNLDVGDATAEQFTAARASGWNFRRKSLRSTAAWPQTNQLLGGTGLQGILLATQQVFSKKVQARGQIGERLPGAFALFR